MMHETHDIASKFRRYEYASDLNPDEFVWNHLKKEGVRKKPLKRNESLKLRVLDDMKAIKRRPALIRSFFRAPSVSYVMA